MTNEQIEQKKQQLKQLAEEVKKLQDELVEAGALELAEDDLDEAAGGYAVVKGENFHKAPKSGDSPTSSAPNRAKSNFF